MAQIVAEVKRQLPDVKVEVTDQFNFEYAEVSVRLTDPSGARLYTAISYDWYSNLELWPLLLPLQVKNWAAELARIRDHPECWGCHCHNPILETEDAKWALT
jgi:hypothetical protein